MDIRTEGVQAVLGGSAILKGVDIQVGQRELVGIIGPNGSGKSTLLKCIYRVLKPTGGAVLLDGRDLDQYSYRESARRIAVVAQHNYYNFEFSVQDVVMMGRAPHKRALDRDNAQDHQMVAQALKTVGMADFARRSFATLSGGEQQRVILARALAQDTPCLILDEPTNHLDLESREALVEALNAFDGTLLMVAHDRYLLSEVADEAWSMDGDGITVYKEGFAEYDVARRAALAASKAGKERDKDAGRKAEGPVPGKALDREELKRLKREQAEQRNALYKKMRPKQEAYAKLETQLEALLTEQSDVEAALADPEVYADGNKTTELLKKFSQLKESSEQALEKLGELEAELAELEAQRAALSMNGGGDEL